MAKPPPQEFQCYRLDRKLENKDSENGIEQRETTFHTTAKQII